jgi:hypothetical protein
VGLIRNFEYSIYNMILKEALLREIFDIDIAFTNEALRCDLQYISTTNIVLKADEYVLISNIRDSNSIYARKVLIYQNN